MIGRARRIFALVTLVVAIAACNNGGGAGSAAPAASAAPAGSSAPAGQSVSPAASGGSY